MLQLSTPHQESHDAYNNKEILYLVFRKRPILTGSTWTMSQEAGSVAISQSSNSAPLTIVTGTIIIKYIQNCLWLRTPLPAELRAFSQTHLPGDDIGFCSIKGQSRSSNSIHGYYSKRPTARSSDELASNPPPKYVVHEMNVAIRICSPGRPLSLYCGRGVMLCFPRIPSAVEATLIR